MSLFSITRSTYRVAKKNLFHSSLTFGGLILGISTSLVLFFYITFELSYDKGHSDWQLIYRITDKMKFDNNFYNSAITPSGWADIVREEIPGLQHVGRINKPPRFNTSVRYEDKLFNEQNVVFIDSTILNILSFKYIHKNNGNPLSYPNGMIINDRIATKYFGDTNPINKEINIIGEGKYIITAVVEYIPGNSFQFDFAALLLPPEDDRLWTHTLIKLDLNSDPSDVQESIQALIKDHFSDLDYVKIQGMKPEIQSLSDIHYSDFKFEYAVSSSRMYVYIFGILALLILFTTAFNFANMKVAEGATRTKEISMRKILGGTKKGIVSQLLVENQLIIASAMILSLVIVLLINPFFNQYIEKEISFLSLTNPFFWMIALLCLVGFGVVCSIFPSLHVWSHSFTNQNSISNNLGKGKQRQYLLAFQFFLSTILIFGGLTVNQQLQYIQNSDLGFKKEKVFVLKFPDEAIKGKFQSFKAELMSNSAIKSISFTQTIPGERESMAVLVYERSSSGETTIIPTFLTDENFVQTLGVELITGRNFNLEVESENRNCIINKEAAELMGWTPAEAIGKEMHAVDLSFKGKVVGVTENFNFSSLHNSIEPLVIFPILDFPQFFNRVLVKTSSEETNQSISHMEKVWDDFTSDAPFNYVLLDDDLNKQYQNENLQSKVFNLFVLLFIGMAVLGLFSLAYFDLERKTKEISIRKVLGASREEIAYSFTSSFLKMVLLAGTIALPVSYFAATEWLNDFSYKTSLGVNLFAYAISINALICVCTVISLAYTKASIDPALQLKQE